MNLATPAQVLAVLDEASAAASVLEYSTALAHLLRCGLQLVYVESAAALAAAELSATRVLGHATARWAPFAPPDIERAWRAEALRLRTLAERASQSKAVPWTLRVTRGALGDAALTLLADADLLLVGAGARAFTLARRAGARPVIAVRDDGGPAGQDAAHIAAQLCQSLNARLVELPPDAECGSGIDLLIVPATLATPRMLATTAAPVLLVRRTPPKGIAGA